MQKLEEIISKDATKMAKAHTILYNTVFTNMFSEGQG